jgi:phosphate transport system permease protein
VAGEDGPASVRGIRVAGAGAGRGRPSGTLAAVGAGPTRRAAVDERFRYFLSFFGPLVVLVPFLVIGIAVVGVAAPSSSPVSPLTVLPTVAGALAAVALAAPPALAASAYVTVLGPRALRGPMARLVALSSSVPAIVIGAFAYFSFAPFLEKFFPGSPRATIGFSAIFALAMAVAPTIANVGRRLALAVPGVRIEAALALGATRRQIAQRLLLPAVGRGLVGALLIAVGRAAGEASAILLLVLAAGPTMTPISVDAARVVLAGGVALGGLAHLVAPLLVVTFVAQTAGRTLVEGTKRRLAGGLARPALPSPWGVRP